MDPQQPILYTNFLLRCLVDSIAVFTRDSSTVTSLTIDGIPLRPKYLNILCSGLKDNATLTKLSLARCRIGDTGCDLLLGCLKNNPRICTLNLSCCRLSNRSGRCLSLFLKRRKADMLQNVWEQSSQEEENNSDSKPRGLHTLILNQNPELGDIGIRQLTYALMDDAWLRTLSLRHCGITKHGAEIMINVLYSNNVITKLDITENRIPINTLQKLLKILKRRRESVGSAALKKRFRLGSRQNTIKSVRCPAHRGGKRSLKQKNGHNAYTSKNNGQWKERLRKLEKRDKRQIKDAQEIRDNVCRRKRLSDLESQLVDLMESNFKLEEELSSNRALLAEQTEQRAKMEDELQKMSLRLTELKSKVIVLNRFSPKACSGSRLMQGLFKYVFDKLESFSTMRQNRVEEERG